MKVKDLKKKLENLPDDLDVKMLLPVVDDWADIKVDSIHLCRLKKEAKCEARNNQNREFFNKELGQDRRTDYTPDEIPEEEWRLYDRIALSSISKEEFEDSYETKKALLISNKSRGKKGWDRHGEVKY